MFSVTSEVAASASFQAAPPKLAVPDPSLPSAGDFGALVDNNLPADPSASLPPSPASSPPPRSASSDHPPPADDAPSRETTAPSDNQPANNDNAPSATAQQTDASAPGDAAADGARKPGAKSTKAGDGKSSDKAASSDQPDAKGDDASAAVPLTQDSGTPATTLITAATAVIIVTPPPLATTAAPPAASGNTPAPLAIAAAGIAASTSTAAALAAQAVQTQDVAAAPKPNGTASPVATTSKTTTPAVTTNPAAAPVQPPPLATTFVEATLAAAAVSAPGTPAAEKPATGFKTEVAAQAKSSATAAVATSFGATDAQAATTAPAPSVQPNAAPQPVPGGKPDNDNAPAPQAKPDSPASADARAPSAPLPHDHPAVTTNAQATVAADPAAQLAGLAAPPQVSVPITTATLTVAPATGAPVPVSGIAVEIAASVQSGKTRFELRLDPADLGRIDVRIDVDRSGQVTSHLTVEKAETLSMLRQDAPQLQQALNDAGLKTGSNGLQFSLRDQSASGQNTGHDNQRGFQPQRLVVSEDTSVPAQLAGQSYGRTAGASGGVDIRV